MKGIHTLLLFSLLLGGCIPYKISTEDYVSLRQQELDVEENIGVCPPLEHVRAREIQTQASKHWVYKVIPRHRSQIRWFDIPHWITWGLFGNDDDGVFGEMFLAPREEEMVTYDGGDAVKWGVRNPLHNFCFYVIGQAYLDNQSELALLKISREEFKILSYKKKADTVFASDESSCFYLGLHSLKPFVSLRILQPKNRRTDFYLGWRERGNFGAKLNPSKKYERAEREIEGETMIVESEEKITLQDEQDR